MKSRCLSLIALAMAVCLITSAACDVDLFGNDFRHVIGPYRLYVWEGGKFALVTETTGEAGCGVLGGTVRQIGWNANVILAEQETCGARGARSGWMVVNVRTRAIEGPIDPTTIPTRSDLAGLKVVSADAAWKQLR